MRATSTPPSIATRVAPPPPTPATIQRSLQPSPLAYLLSGLLTIVALVASSVGALYPAIFRDPAATAGNACGTAIVILVVALPALAAGMALTARGSLRAQLVWLGALCYLAYNAAFFAFAVTFNSLFPLYVAALGLAAWALIALLTSLDAQGLRARFVTRVPRRAIAGFLTVITALFAAVWLADMLPAVMSDGVPDSLRGASMLTNAIQVMDFAFGFPLTLLAAVWLWRRRAWGYVLAGGALVYWVIEAISVTVDQLFGHLSDPAQPLATVLVFAVLALITLVPAATFLRGQNDTGR